MKQPFINKLFFFLLWFCPYSPPNSGSSHQIYPPHPAVEQSFICKILVGVVVQQTDTLHCNCEFVHILDALTQILGFSSFSDKVFSYLHLFGIPLPHQQESIKVEAKCTTTTRVPPRWTFFVINIEPFSFFFFSPSIFNKIMFQQNYEYRVLSTKKFIYPKKKSTNKIFLRLPHFFLTYKLSQSCICQRNSMVTNFHNLYVVVISLTKIINSSSKKK